MDITENRQGNIPVVSINGRLDHNSSAPLEKRLGALVDAGAKHIVLEAANLEYVSSVGLRVLILTAKRLKTAGGNLLIAGLVESVRMIFKISGLEATLALFPDTEAALASIAPKTA